MKDSSLPNPDATPEKADSRRQFLQTAGVVAGALVLTRSLPAVAQITPPTAPALPPGAAPAPGEADGEDAVAADEMAPGSAVLHLSKHPKLDPVGGSEIVIVHGERVIVAHTASGFVACSAVCTHRGCDVGYNLAAKQFVCPCHGARFDEGGKVVKGPARRDLKKFDAASALVVKSST